MGEAIIGAIVIGEVLIIVTSIHELIDIVPPLRSYAIFLSINLPDTGTP